MDSNFNNFFQQQLWGVSAGGAASGKSLTRNEITSSDKNSSISGQSSSTSAVLAPSKLAQSQPLHSTNRDVANLSLENRLYLDGLRHHHHHQQQAQQQPRHGSNFSNMSLALAGNGGSRDSNNNGPNSNQSMGFSASQKLLHRLDIDSIRNNVNRNCNNSSMMHHQHGTILFNTLNGGLGAGGLADCFNSSEYGHPDSTTPPPTAISMPLSASSASSSSSNVSTNLGLNRSSSGSQDGNPEKVKTPNSIRGEKKILIKGEQPRPGHFIFLPL